MRESPKIPYFFLAVALTVAMAPSFAAFAGAGDFSQIAALAAVQQVNKSGSDNSLNSSTTNAMQALMDLANQNRTGAISNGYKAFGQYRNSGDLDNLRLKNAVNALKMDSIGNYIQANGQNNIFLAPLSDYDTTYRRVDPKSLRSGEAGKIADQFEKATGMSRETFLNKMTAASESSIKVSDPHLVDKVLGKFEEFVKDIPNADFRAAVEKEIAKVPETARTGLISQAVQKFSQMFAGASVAPKSDLALVAKDQAARALASAPAAKAGSEPGDKKEDKKAEASSALKGTADEKPALASNVMLPRAEFRGIDYDPKAGNDAVGNVLQTALDEQGGDDTIFKQISRKYRSLSASLVQQPM